MDSGEQAITDAAEAAALKRQAMKVYAQSLALAVVLTAIELVLP